MRQLFNFLIYTFILKGIMKGFEKQYITLNVFWDGFLEVKEKLSRYDSTRTNVGIP